MLISILHMSLLDCPYDSKRSVESYRREESAGQLDSKLGETVFRINWGVQLASTTEGRHSSRPRNGLVPETRAICHLLVDGG